jgi:hypothetical protein
MVKYIVDTTLFVWTSSIVWFFNGTRRIGRRLCFRLQASEKSCFITNTDDLVRRRGTKGRGRRRRSQWVTYHRKGLTELNCRDTSVHVHCRMGVNDRSSTPYDVQTHPIYAVMPRSCHPVDLGDNYQHHRPWTCAQKNPIFASLLLHSNIKTYTNTSLPQWDHFRIRHRHWLQILKPPRLNIVLTKVRLLGPIVFNCKLHIKPKH